MPDIACVILIDFPFNNFQNKLWNESLKYMFDIGFRHEVL